MRARRRAMLRLQTRGRRAAMRRPETQARVTTTAQGWHGIGVPFGDNDPSTNRTSIYLIGKNADDWDIELGEVKHMGMPVGLDLFSGSGTTFYSRRTVAGGTDFYRINLDAFTADPVATVSFGGFHAMYGGSTF